MPQGRSVYGVGRAAAFNSVKKEMGDECSVRGANVCSHPDRLGLLRGDQEARSSRLAIASRPLYCTRLGIKHGANFFHLEKCGDNRL